MFLQYNLNYRKGAATMSNNRQAPYDDGDIYKGFFFTRIKQTVYKWWCVIYKPVYKLMHHGNWPEEKEPGYVPPKKDEPTSDFAAQMAEKIMHEKQDAIAETIAQQMHTANTQNAAPVQNDSTASDDSSTVTNGWDDSVDTSGMSTESVDLAKEIMERLAREAAEDEAKKQAEIDKARQSAAEKERLEEIMRSNKVDISQYIEKGRAQAHQPPSDSNTN